MRGRPSQALLRTSAKRAQDAAWQFLDAVRELFPRKIEELTTLGESCVDNAVEALGSDLDEDDPLLCDGQPFGPLADVLRRCVHEWTLKCGISCSAVDEVATRIVLGHTGPEPALTKLLDAIGKPLPEPSPIQASPLNETLDTFLQRAREHYKEVADFYIKRGLKKGPIKRKSDHFLWLAAYLVGGYSWAEIARLGLRGKSEKTVAGEARKVASLIGIRLGNRPGPRPGSHPRPAAHRARR
jgi:hypothetical protein